ncbi:ABC transporter permease [Promicromonospora citrea]|uniref:Nitrate ABC transporter permease n=1 Tax=Promicromonospora citrea TaxID=43677 RepID=A0A8H9GQK4_9MICO|nr:ABC transporter permease subunit [Promicromonospora citrea]NNH51473.1 ABC transporter permease subunit [Promicromonospora citrea]GGM40372.1 nitrate ABC transporter permease [Promicromonospora citrea]
MSTLRRVARSVLLTLGLPVAILTVWWVASAGSTSFYSPPLAEIVGTSRETWFSAPLAESRLAVDVVPSVLRLLAGYAVALVVGVALGVAVGSSRALRAFLEPVLEFFRAIPPPVLVPVLMLFFGIGDTMKIVVIAIGCVWPVLLNTVEGVRGLDPVLRDTARAYRLGRVATLRHLVLRGASPQIVTGARQALSIGIILMVISEMFAAKDGLGFSIVQFQRSFAIPEMWSGVLLLGVVGVLLSLVFRAVTDAVLRWYLGYRQSQHGGA